MKHTFAGLTVIMGSVWLVGCGPNCQNTCNQLFDEAACGLTRPGIERSESIRECVRTCEDALNQPGELGGFNPNEQDTTNDAELDNEKQAVEWMECVWQTAPDASAEQCAAFEQGYCAPTLF